MIFYAYDLELYKKERDFYIDYENFVPGVIAKDFDALLKALENLPDNSEKSKRFWDEYMDFCDGNTAQKIVEFMEKML